MKKTNTPPHSRTQNPHRLRVASLPATRTTAFTMVPTPDERRQIADDLDLLALRKLRFSGKIQADGPENWRLDGVLGATVVQPCVRTLAPLTTRIDEKVSRRFLVDMPDNISPAETQTADRRTPNKGGTPEIEMPEDETIEPLTPVIDLWAIMIESLALALPLYPKAPDASGEAALSGTRFSAPATTTSEEMEPHPFAGLSALRDTLNRKKGDK